MLRVLLVIVYYHRRGFQLLIATKVSTPLACLGLIFCFEGSGSTAAYLSVSKEFRLGSHLFYTDNERMGADGMNRLLRGYIASTTPTTAS